MNINQVIDIIKFENNGIVNNKITFSSSYFCYKLLPKQIIMENLKGNT